MTSILVPIDGSESSLNALKGALSWEKDPYKLKLHIINVQPQLMSTNVRRYITEEALNDYYRIEAETALSKARLLLSDVSYEEAIAIGPIAESISEYVKKHHIEHLMMGTRGLGSVKGILLGSIATKVLTLVDIPVTLYK
jgi:nucleotide-binding universal stress UspA family protein